MSRPDPSSLPVALVAAAVLLVAAVAVPAAASPAPVSACPPCDEGFVHAAERHGLDTEVRFSTATVRVHRNGSATWTARVEPTNESALNRLAENESLGRAVARDSFGVRYGSGIDHRLLGADVVDGAFVIRYLTLDVVRDGPFGTVLFTYFRDSPGAYVYTDLGADHVAVIPPERTVVARGFGDVDDRRLTALALPEVRDGPFVVFAPAGSPTPRLLGALAVADALAGVVARNVLLFVLVPGGVIAGGLAAVRRAVPTERPRDRSDSRRIDPRDLGPGRLGTAVAAVGTLLLGGTLAAEADALPAATGNLLVGGVVGGVLLVLGAAVAVPAARRSLTTGRLVGAGAALGTIVVLLGGDPLGGDVHATLAMGAALFPAALALGRADAAGGDGTRLLLAVTAATAVSLAALAPLRALGGSLFPLAPVLLTGAALVFVPAVVPLYLLGAASVAAPDRRGPAG